MIHDTLFRPDLDAVVITPEGDLDGDATGALREVLAAAGLAGSHLVVDLHAVHVIDQAALGLLVRARQRTRQRDGVFALVAPSRFVQTVLHTMRLDHAFLICPDVPEALAAIGLESSRAAAS